MTNLYKNICNSQWSKILILTIAISLLTCLANAEKGGLKSHFTSVKVQDCWKPKGHFAKYYDMADHVRECRAPKGWHLFFVADSERSWLDIARGRQLWSTEEEVTNYNNFGQSQDLGDLARVEWRLTPDGNPVALIFRVQAIDPNSPPNTVRILTRLYIIGLSKGVPQICGVVKTNEEGRNIADNPVNCKDLPKQPATR